MSDIKPGSLAVIIATKHVENRHLIGRCVKVLDRTPVGDYQYPDGRRGFKGPKTPPSWIIEDKEVTRIIARYLREMQTAYTQYHSIRDNHLMPLDPDAEVTETCTETLPA